MLCGMSPILMVVTIKTLIKLGQVSPHLIRSFEVGLIFYLLEDLVNWLLK